MLWGQKDQKDMKALDATLQIKRESIEKKKGHRETKKSRGT